MAGVSIVNPLVAYTAFIEEWERGANLLHSWKKEREMLFFCSVPNIFNNLVITKDQIRSDVDGLTNCHVCSIPQC
jgi:hypothetical protein